MLLKTSSCVHSEWIFVSNFHSSLFSSPMLCGSISWSYFLFTFFFSSSLLYIVIIYPCCYVNCCIFHTLLWRGTVESYFTLISYLCFVRCHLPFLVLFFVSNINFVYDFPDQVNFSRLSSQRSPEDIITLMSELFDMMDKVAEQCKIERIKIIGVRIDSSNLFGKCIRLEHLRLALLKCSGNMSHDTFYIH